MADEVKPQAGELATTNYGWLKPNVGDTDDLWGGMLNADLDGIDSVVKGVSNAIPAASSTTPLMSGTAAVGAGTTWARADHVHPSDTSRMPRAGITDGSDAAAGQIGEVISSNVTSAVTLTSGTLANLTNISLSPGDWDVSGEIWISTGNASATSVQGAINTVSATLPAASALGTARTQITTAASLAGNAIDILALRSCRANVTTPTTYYLVVGSVFGAATTTATGNIIARRVR